MTTESDINMLDYYVSQLRGEGFPVKAFITLLEMTKKLVAMDDCLVTCPTCADRYKSIGERMQALIIVFGENHKFEEEE